MDKKHLAEQMEQLTLEGTDNTRNSREYENSLLIMESQGAFILKTKAWYLENRKHSAPQTSTLDKCSKEKEQQKSEVENCWITGDM